MSSSTNPYIIKIYYGDDSRIRNTLAVSGAAKQQNIIDTLLSEGATLNGDKYQCPTTFLVDLAKSITTIYGGVISDFFSSSGIPSVSPSVISEKSSRVTNPYTIKIYYNDGSMVGHILAVSGAAKLQNIIDTLLSEGATLNEDKYHCPTMFLVELAKSITTVYGGVVSDFTSAIPPVANPVVSKMSSQVVSPYNIKIHYGDGSGVKHTLALSDAEKQRHMIGTLVREGAKLNGDCYICPTTYVVDLAKYHTRIYGGVVHDL